MKKKAVEALEFDNEIIQAREAAVAAETDDEIIARLAEHFEVLEKMTKAVKSGDIRAMIVSGPPGVGKSHGVENVLEKADIFGKIAGWEPKYEIVKGTMSSIGLYAKLYEYSDEKSVIVFDDCDTVLMEDLSLNILKAALDSSKRRFISWNTDSRLLRSEGIPDRFEFKGAAIFITNIKFDQVKSKRLREHLNALESRCHYIDLQMDTAREKILRIKQIVAAGMLKDNDYDFTEDEVQEIIDFIVDNKDKLRELSLRMVLKIANHRKTFPSSWQSMARSTCMRRI